jgi:WD40 repeat protein
MIHSIAINASDYDGPDEIFVTAQGNCCVALYDIKAIGNNSNKVTKVRKDRDKKVERASQNNPQNGPCLWMSDVSGLGHTGCVNSAAFMPNTHGRKLLSGGNDGKFCIWDWQTQSIPAALLYHKRKINWVTVGNGILNVDAIIADVRGKLIAVDIQ